MLRYNVLPFLFSLRLMLHPPSPPSFQWIGSKLVSWLRRGNTPEGGWSVPPHAVAGLYLRETPDRRLAMMTKPPLGSADSDGDAGAGDGRGVGGATHDVEFGAILEGSSVFGVEIEGRRGGQGAGSGSAGGGIEVQEGDLGIEMMELGGELERVQHRSLVWRSAAFCLGAVDLSVGCWISRDAACLFFVCRLTICIYVPWGSFQQTTWCAGRSNTSVLILSVQPAYAKPTSYRWPVVDVDARGISDPG